HHSWPRSYHDARAGLIAFAVGWHQNPAVRASDRLQWDIAEAYGFDFFIQATHRHHLGKTERRGDLARKIGRLGRLVELAPAQLRQNVAADQQPRGHGRIDATGNQQDRTRTGKAEGRGFARHDGDAVRIDLSEG